MTFELAVIKDSRSDKYMPKIRRDRMSYNGRLHGSVATAERDIEEFLDCTVTWTHPPDGTVPGRGLVEGSVRSWAEIQLEAKARR